MDPITVNCTIIDWCEVTAILFDTFMAACFTVLLGGIVALGVFCYRRRKYKKQESVLHALAVMRTKGVRIRNERAEPVFSQEDLDAWLKGWKSDEEKWHSDLRLKVRKFSKVEAERLRTLDLMPLRDFDYAVTPDHLHRLRILTETLHRLDRMLGERFRPQDAP